MSLPAPLMFTVGLIDQITKPIAKISNRLNDLSANYQAGTMQMASGIGGVVASGYALQRALMPAIEMDRALGEVASLGVRDSALKMLSQNSYEYALKYGESAVDFVRSSYDIQSAIAGLNDADLSRFTMASNVLAKATKADAATVTNYMGTMYGIFKNDAKAMGEGAWIERVTGMTATAVQAFKTDGKKMSDAFGALGAAAGLAPLEEQMAIMGTLQATMQGSESATKYKAFLAGVGKAQKALNLEFADANGNMLPMVDILNKIKGKFGETISVAEGDQLAKAFGSQEAVALVKLLLNDIDGLSGSINQLGKVKGMEQAEKMAAAMTDQSQRLAQSWFVIRAAFGSAILPAFNSFVGKIADMGRDVLWFTDMFPNITRWLGYFGIGLMLSVAAGGLFTIMLGAGKMALTTWAMGVDIAKWAGTKYTAMLVRMRAATLAVNLAMAANPIGVIVTAVVALIGVVVAAVYYFDDLRKMMAGTAWGEPILFAVDAIIDLLKMLAGVAVGVFSVFVSVLKGVWQVLKPIASFLFDVLVFALKVVGAVAGAVFGVMAYGIGSLVNLFTWLTEAIFTGFELAFGLVAQGWQGLVNAFTNFEWFQSLMSAAGMIGEFMSQLWDGIKAKFAKMWGWVVDKLNVLPGINIKVEPVVEATEIKGINDKSGWMQRQAANDPVNYVYAAAEQNGSNKQVIPSQLNQQLNVQRNLPKPYQPEQLTQTVQLKPVNNELIASTVTPRYDQQAAVAANNNRKAGQINNSKSTHVGTVNIYPTKGDSDFLNYVEMHA